MRRRRRRRRRKNKIQMPPARPCSGRCRCMGVLLARYEHNGRTIGHHDPQP
jgi:hypothetical protein